MAAPRLFKFVELSTVTDEEIERVVNEWVQKGWELESLHFAMRDSSRRPAMAFIAFTRVKDGEGDASVG